jgi:glycerate 2-kinase
MRVLIAFDKFKDALTAPAACEIARKMIAAQHPDWTLDLCPLADGGE